MRDEVGVRKWYAMEWFCHAKTISSSTSPRTDLDKHEIVVHEVEIVERLEKPGITGEGHGVGGGGRIPHFEVVMLENPVGGGVDEPRVVRHEDVLVTWNHRP